MILEPTEWGETEKMVAVVLLYYDTHMIHYQDMMPTFIEMGVDVDEYEVEKFEEKIMYGDTPSNEHAYSDIWEAVGVDGTTHP